VSAGGVAASSPSRRIIEKLLLSAGDKEAATLVPTLAPAFQMTREIQELDLLQGLALVGETRLVGLLSFDTISRNATEREAGFDSNMVSGYGGVSFSIGDNSVLGLGVDISQWSGNLYGNVLPTELVALEYNIANGTFEENGFGPVAYFSTNFLDVGFFQAWTSYEFIEAKASKEGLVGIPVSPGLETQSAVDSRELSLGAQTIFGFGLARYQVSPEIGLEFVRRWTDAFTETWEPGSVVIQFDKEDRTSLQSGVGVGIATVVQWRNMKVQPYFALDWIHEFLDPARTIRATFSGFDTPFEFRTDEPDRDWFELSGEVSFELAGRIFASLAAQVELDHRYYDRASIYGGISIPLN
jgi:hypothetical protein